MNENEPTSTGPGTLGGLAAPGFWGRLRIYLIGVGIGVILLGTIWMMKRNAILQQGAAGAGQTTTIPVKP